MNVLNSFPFNTPYQTPPFDKIKDEDFLPAIQKAIEEAKKEIQSIIQNTETPNFYNTIEALEKSGKKLDYLSGLFFNLNSAHTNDIIQKEADKIAPLLSQFSSEISLNKDLFEKINSVYKSDHSALNKEQLRLLEQSYLSASRSGAQLDEEQKKELQEIDQKLAMLSLDFGKNVLAETNNYFLNLTNELDVKGIPDDALNEAREIAKSKDLEGYVFTLHAPSYMAVIKYAENRSIREKIYRANGKKASKDNDNNNEQNILDIISLRNQRAKILGYDSHPDYVLERRMAKSADNVESFLNDLKTKAYPFAKKDIKKLKEFAKELDGITDLMPWDHAYYSEKLKKSLFNLSDEKIKPYFSLQNVLEGAFKIAEKLYSIEFVKNTEIPVYHKDVTTYEVKENGKVIGIFYADFFPRDSKRAGAWMTSFRNGFYEDNQKLIPLISIVCNFTKPTKEKPSLLTFNEVTTLFHEFGHALHGLLGDTHYASLSGTNVFWDFVELPSQFMENFCYQEEALELFAKHYKTQETIPSEIIENIKRAGNFMEGYQSIRQVSLGQLDMAWHTVDPNKVQGVEAFEKEILKETALYPLIDGLIMSTSFAHIFQGGYSSGYYSYKWAEVLDADAFEMFEENGIFDPITAKKFKTLLSSGGTVDPAELYESFRGRQADPNALLKRAGLVETK